MKMRILVAISALCFVPFCAFAKSEIAPKTSAPASSTAQNFKGNAIGEMQIIKSRYEDTIVKLAREYGLGYVEIRAANPTVDPWLPGDGTKITLPTMNLLPKGPRKGIVINLAEMRMYVYYGPGIEPASYPVGIGREGLTSPLGTTTVARKMVGPIWRPTDRMRKEDPKLKATYYPGPDNPMGTHAMYLGFPSYAIHGTNKPYSIGWRLSSGCIRMYPEDITTLYNFTPEGTQVTIVDQPIKTAWIGNDFYVEVHPTQEQADIISRDGKPDYQVADKDIQQIVKEAGSYADDLNWDLVRAAIKNRYGYPIKVLTRPAVEQASATAPVKPMPEKIP